MAARPPLAVSVAGGKPGPGAKMAVSCVVSLCGLAWFLDGGFAIGWMPF